MMPDAVDSEKSLAKLLPLLLMVTPATALLVLILFKAGIFLMSPSPMNGLLRLTVLKLSIDEISSLDMDGISSGKIILGNLGAGRFILSLGIRRDSSGSILILVLL